MAFVLSTLNDCDQAKRVCVMLPIQMMDSTPAIEGEVHSGTWMCSDVTCPLSKTIHAPKVGHRRMEAVSAEIGVVVRAKARAIKLDSSEANANDGQTKTTNLSPQTNSLRGTN